MVTSYFELLRFGKQTSRVMTNDEALHRELRNG